MTDLDDNGFPEQQSQDPDVFEVERIVKRRKKRNNYEYFVKWYGYDSDANTWEPPENIGKDLLRDFIKSASRKRFNFDEDDAQNGDDPEEPNTAEQNADNSVHQQSSPPKKKKNKNKRARHHEDHYHNAKSKIIAIPVKHTATITSDETSDKMEQASQSPILIENEPSVDNPTLETQDKNCQAMTKAK